MNKMDFIKGAVAQKLRDEYGADDLQQHQSLPISERLFKSTAVFDGGVIPFIVKRAAKEIGLTKLRRRSKSK